MDEVHKGMPFSQFRNELNTQNAHPGDRVVINGGEPTIHPEFFSFLEEASGKKCFIDLYTNGLKLAEPQFVENIARYSPMLIRIPVFGATAKKHDLLTGKKGNFDKLMDTFYNLEKFDREKDDFYVEVKLLLSKATIDENLKIIKLFEKRFPGLFYFSLNPLISSDKVIKNQKMLVQPLEELVKKSEPLIKYAIDNDIQLDINLIPFCLIPEKFRKLITLPDRKMLEEHYSDPFTKDSLNQKFESAKCYDCFYKKGCKGFPPHYFNLYSESTVKPFSEPFAVNS